ncbi:SDR family NAD(P)-dependent oxidoreductase [uncultured Amnibacterium sp.]|uniref:SDR family NAD(P)-dependent oxidoreductase n=1 Tax=uncultured Amnibacterium sp. TaxID=1631851 RepID=UPI0035CBF155
MAETQDAWVVTGPTSGYGRATALELARHGTVVLVGRSPQKLAAVRSEIQAAGGEAVAVVADFSDVVSVRRAAKEVVALDLPIRGVLNNAGIQTADTTPTAQGWDPSFATNHLGPLAFTESLFPALADGTNVVFIASAVEDPERKPAVRVGFRGGRYLSAEAAARGEYTPGGSTRPGFDAYATSKQGSLAAVFNLARQHPRLRFRAIEPGVNPGSNLGDLPAAARAIARVLTPVLTVIPHVTTSKRAAKVITRIVTDPSGATGIYYDENGAPLQASKQVSDPAFSDRYIAESRALLATVPD